MAEGGLDDYEVQDLDENYPEYDDMNYEQVLDHYEKVSDLLLDHQYLEDNLEEKIKYEKRYHY